MTNDRKQPKFSMEGNIGAVFERCIAHHWDLPSLSNVEGAGAYRYREVANLMARNHYIWRQAGLEPGFRLALCGRNSAEWCITFLSAITYGAVIVPLLNEFTPEMVTRLVSHAEAKILVVGRHIWKNIDPATMPGLRVAMADDASHEILYSQSDNLEALLEQAGRDYDAQYPDGVRRDDLHYYRFQPDDMVMINYTSGTTREPKGVMIPERAVWSNMAFAEEVLPNLSAGMNVVSMLPTAHLYGMAFEFLYEFMVGIHIHFINRAPTPTIISKALRDVKPDLIVVVPMIIEKVVKKKLMPVWNAPRVRFARRIPLLSTFIKRKMCQALYDGLGGRFYELIIGGSGLNPDIERILHDIRFPYTVGYGMTECAPIIAYADWKTFKPYSCGRPAPRMEVRILSDDPQQTPGEIVTRGTNVMLGYYRNSEETAAAIDREGWLHTGDMGVMDAEQNIFIKGRIKNMLLSASGQNVYPEEIETQLNALPLVAESIVVQREHRLVALVFPEATQAKIEHLTTNEEILKFLRSMLPQINAHFPAYSQVADIELVDREFEKTPKKSIRRFLYK